MTVFEYKDGDGIHSKFCRSNGVLYVEIAEHLLADSRKRQNLAGLLQNHISDRDIKSIVLIPHVWQVN